jgi:hypothetical protein
MITFTDLDAGPEIPHPAPMGVTELIIANRLLTDEEFHCRFYFVGIKRPEIGHILGSGLIISVI